MLIFLNICNISDTLTKPIQHIVYKEGKGPPNWNGMDAIEYTDDIKVQPGIDYSVKVEVLRNDLGSSDEKVSRIALNGREMGYCNPDGGDMDCTFFDCSTTLLYKHISSPSGLLVAALRYQGHSRDCDCDKGTWQCAKEDTKAGFSPMLAVAKITLTPLIGN